MQCLGNVQMTQTCQVSMASCFIRGSPSLSFRMMSPLRLSVTSKQAHTVHQFGKRFYYAAFMNVTKSAHLHINLVYLSCLLMTGSLHNNH